MFSSFTLCSLSFPGFAQPAGKTSRNDQAGAAYIFFLFLLSVSSVTDVNSDDLMQLLLICTLIRQLLVHRSLVCVYGSTVLGMRKPTPPNGDNVCYAFYCYCKR